VSATPEQILAALENEAFDMEETARTWGGESQAAPPLRAAAALIRAQAERVRVLEEENEQLKIGLEVAEKLYRETLGMKGDAGYG